MFGDHTAASLLDRSFCQFKRSAFTFRLKAKSFQDLVLAAGSRNLRWPMVFLSGHPWFINWFLTLWFSTPSFTSKLFEGSFYHWSDALPVSVSKACGSEVAHRGLHYRTEKRPGLVLILALVAQSWVRLPIRLLSVQDRPAQKPELNRKLITMRSHHWTAYKSNLIQKSSGWFTHFHWLTVVEVHIL